MPTIQRNEGQSIFDLAIQHTGSIESAFIIAVKNNISITSPGVAGWVDVPTPINSRICNIIAAENSIPASYPPAAPVNDTLDVDTPLINNTLSSQ